MDHFSGENAAAVMLSMLSQKVDNASLLKMFVEVAFAEFEMFRVRQIDVAIGCTGEGNDEAVSETIVEILRAGVFSPFKSLHASQPRTQCAERGFNRLHRCVRRACLEPEKNDMAVGRAGLIHPCNFSGKKAESGVRFIQSATWICFVSTGTISLRNRLRKPVS